MLFIESERSAPLKIPKKFIKPIDKLIMQRHNILHNNIIRGDILKSEQKKLGEAELEIMQAIWSEDTAITSVAIRDKLKERRDRQLSSLMSSLYRLEDKGFIKCTRSGGMNLYSATVSENDYKAGASESFLKRLYNNSARGLVATLYRNNLLKEDDLRDLRDFIDELERENRE